jgi:hypothetical protein
VGFGRKVVRNEDMTETNSTGTLEARKTAKAAKAPQTATQTPVRNSLSLDRVHERVETVTPLLKEVLAYSHDTRHWGLND